MTPYEKDAECDSLITIPKHSETMTPYEKASLRTDVMIALIEGYSGLLLIPQIIQQAEEVFKEIGI